MKEKFNSEESNSKKISTFDRLFSQQTLSSSRKCTKKIHFKNFIPENDLDILLTTVYDHARDVFQEKVDIVLQPETIEFGNWKKNCYHEDTDPPTRVGSLKEIKNIYNSFHPLLIGGITEKRHPQNVKLMNSSHHSPQTIAGYVRKEKDGSLFQY